MHIIPPGMGNESSLGPLVRPTINRDCRSRLPRRLARGVQGDCHGILSFFFPFFVILIFFFFPCHCPRFDRYWFRPYPVVIENMRYLSMNKSFTEYLALEFEPLSQTLASFASKWSKYVGTTVSIALHEIHAGFSTFLNASILFISSRQIRSLKYNSTSPIRLPEGSGQYE